MTRLPFPFSELDIIAAQLNPTVGDLNNNTNQIKHVWTDNAGADLILFPETFLTGYPLYDLVLRPSFLTAVEEYIDNLRIFSQSHKAAALIPTPWRIEGRLYNAALLIQNGDIKNIILKHELPNYGVFDEKRLFSSGPLGVPIEIKGHKLGLMICEDAWQPTLAAHLEDKGAEALIVINGSPFETDKDAVRKEHMRARIDETALPLLYLNMTGGQDELVFDGASFMMDQKGGIIFQIPAFETIIQNINQVKSNNYPALSEAYYEGAVIALRDYIHKTGFTQAIIGLSGGIDSALTAVMAADALGPENVHCVLLPSPFTSDHSIEDAEALCHALDIKYDIIPIEPAMNAFSSMIKGLSGLAHENMQARARGVTLMTLSNQTGALLLSTGNKSELAVGYSTLYGDMCGAFNPLKDIYKTTVTELCILRNRWKPAFGKAPAGIVIPERIITKPPSAELREDQKDEDSLPAYDVLDRVLIDLIEHERAPEEIIAEGFDAEIVEKVYHLLQRAEYKRQQSCPGVNLTKRPLAGRSRRYPIVNKF